MKLFLNRSVLTRCFNKRKNLVARKCKVPTSYTTFNFSLLCSICWSRRSRLPVGTTGRLRWRVGCSTRYLGWVLLSTQKIVNCSFKGTQQRFFCLITCGQRISSHYLRSFFYLSGLANPTSQFLNGTHKFSDLVLTRMALFKDQRCSDLPLLSAKALENKCTRAPWTFPCKLVRTRPFRPARKHKWKAALSYSAVFQMKYRGRSECPTTRVWGESRRCFHLAVGNSRNKIYCTFNHSIFQLVKVNSPALTFRRPNRWKDQDFAAVAQINGVVNKAISAVSPWLISTNSGVTFKSWIEISVFEEQCPWRYNARTYTVYMIRQLKSNKYKELISMFWCWSLTAWVNFFLFWFESPHGKSF